MLERRAEWGSPTERMESWFSYILCANMAESWERLALQPSAPASFLSSFSRSGLTGRLVGTRANGGERQRRREEGNLLHFFWCLVAGSLSLCPVCIHSLNDVGQNSVCSLFPPFFQRLFSVWNKGSSAGAEAEAVVR